MDFSGSQRIKVKNAVSVHFQRALKDPSRGIKIMSGEMIGYFPQKNTIYIFFYLVLSSSAMHMHTLCTPVRNSLVGQKTPISFSPPNHPTSLHVYKVNMHRRSNALYKKM